MYGDIDIEHQEPNEMPRRQQQNPRERPSFFSAQNQEPSSDQYPRQQANSGNYWSDPQHGNHWPSSQADSGNGQSEDVNSASGNPPLSSIPTLDGPSVSQHVTSANAAIRVPSPFQMDLQETDAPSSTVLRAQQPRQLAERQPVIAGIITNNRNYENDHPLMVQANHLSEAFKEFEWFRELTHNDDDSWTIGFDGSMITGERVDVIIQQQKQRYPTIAEYTLHKNDHPLMVQANHLIDEAFKEFEWFKELTHNDDNSWSVRFDGSMTTGERVDVVIQQQKQRYPPIADYTLYSKEYTKPGTRR